MAARDGGLAVVLRCRFCRGAPVARSRRHPVLHNHLHHEGIEQGQPHLGPLDLSHRAGIRRGRVAVPRSQGTGLSALFRLRLDLFVHVHGWRGNGASSHPRLGTVGKCDRGSNLAVAASTMASVAAFNPCVAGFSNGSSAGSTGRDSMAKGRQLAFAERLRSSGEFDVLKSGLLKVLANTVQPATVAIWTRRERSGPSGTDRRH